MQNKIINRMKNNLIEGRVIIGMVLFPILIVMGVLGIMLGSGNLLGIVVGLFSIEKHGYVYGVLYPTMWGNIFLILVTAITALIGFGLMVVWLRWIFRSIGLSLMIIEYFVVMCVIIFLPALMIFRDEDVFKTYQIYRLDIEAYEKGEVKTYYGEIEKEEQRRLEVTQGNNLPNDALQYWKCRDESLYLKSATNLIDTFGYREGEEYQIMYLPRTYLITNIQPIEH